MFFSDFSDDKNLIEKIVRKVFYPEKKKLYCNILCYYSPKDIWVGFGYNNVKDFMMRGFGQNSKSYIDQRRGIKGSFSFQHRYLIKDLYGLNSGVKGGLKAVAGSLNIPLADKGLLDGYKEIMSAAVKFHPVDYIKYAIGDVQVLNPILRQKINNHNKLLTDTFQMKKESLFNEFDFPLTQGSLINKTYLKVFFQNIEREVDLTHFTYAGFKLGILNRKHKKYLWNLQIFRDSFRHRTDPLDIQFEGYIYPTLKDFFNYNIFSFSVFNSASVPYFLSADKKTSAYLNAMVTGGRTIREDPSTMSIVDGADIDLVSCYGTALKDFIQPIGLPTIYSRTPNEPYMSLGIFFDMYKGELINNLYKIVVSGAMTCGQDLIYSKIISKGSKNNFSKNNAFFDGDFESLQFLNSKLVLLRKEIINGTITSDIHELVTKIGSAQEKRNYFNLRVETAVFWKKSDRVPNAKKWSEIILAQDQKYQYNMDVQGTIDYRSRKWFAYPIGKFISPLLEMRNTYKKKMKDAKSPVQKEYYNALQNGVKLNVNTLYGCFCSPYFPIGNAVVADNITAKARAHAWLSSKGLGFIQSITDGGSYPINSVWYLTEGGKKPSLATFSKIPALRKHRCLKRGPLLEVEHSMSVDNPDREKIMAQLDDAATKHLEKFWAPYKIKMAYKLEHKLENCFSRAAYWGKSNYALQVYNPETAAFDKTVKKIRGQREFFEGKMTPYYQLFDYILKDIVKIDFPLKYKSMRLLSIGDWRQSIEADPEFKTRPGEALVTDRKLRFNNGEMPLDFIEAFNEVDRRTRNPDRVLFEKYLTVSIYKTHRQMLFDIERVNLKAYAKVEMEELNA